MKILFICPPSETPFKQDDEYPLGLVYLASVLEKEGHEVLVKDYITRDWEKVKEEIINEVKISNPEVVGLSCVTMNRSSCFKLAKMIKKFRPKIKIIMGGVHATSLYEQILLNLPIDAIVMGEGEVTTPQLVNALETGNNLNNVKGISFKDGKKVIFTGHQEPIHNLDSIPFPKHELFKDRIKKTGTALMITSRGCPFGCTFCSTSRYWGRLWRPRSAKNVVDEIEYLKTNFPYVKRIFFHDDTLILDNKRIIDICNDILKRGIKIEWVCSGRVDRVSKEMLKKMKEAGCVRITYGVESGSPKILKSIEKNITREQIKKAIQITNEVGLDYRTYLMVGNPGESWDTIKETVEFLKELKNLSVESVGRLEIYPNTEIYQLAKKQGIIDDSYWLKDKKVPHYTYEHSENELTKMAYAIVASNQMQKGWLNFVGFGVKFFFDKPKKAMKYILMKMGLIR